MSHGADLGFAEGDGHHSQLDNLIQGTTRPWYLICRLDGMNSTALLHLIGLKLMVFIPSPTGFGDDVVGGVCVERSTIA